MTFVNTKTLEPAAPTTPLKGRALSKQRTREKILAAARELFTERGYEGATVRDIAKAAGMSTGAVFASFADKAELFDEIIAQDYQALADEMAAAVRDAATVDDALLGLFGAAYRNHVQQVPMVRAAMSVGWTRDASTAQRSRDALKPIVGLLRDALQQAQDRGELASSADIRLLREIIWEVYLSGYRAAVHKGSGADEMLARLASQLEVILAGSRA
ncbi:MAG TPA: TetR/AcrR family transcriptional regulator [Caulobacteraceae bacterium]|nr:TetR/AcrR family transcriptional regulator [Caulobacteraceae bacterium]